MSIEEALLSAILMCGLAQNQMGHVLKEIVTIGTVIPQMIGAELGT
jgi:hypothetical protein